MNKYFLLCIFLKLFTASFSVSGGGLEDSYEIHPEITELLNEAFQDEYCDTYIALDNGYEPVTLIGRRASVEYYLVYYVNDCGTSGRDGSVLISKEGREYRISEVRLPFPDKVEIKGVEYDLYSSRTEFSEGIYSAHYNIACKGGDYYFSVGACESRTSYEIILEYTFSSKESKFQLISKTVELNQ